MKPVLCISLALPHPSQIPVLPLSGSAKKVQKLRSRDNVGTCILPPPVPNPAIGYVAIGENERCLEAHLTPLRRLMEEEEHQGRELRLGPSPTYPTSTQCYDCTCAGSA